MYSKILNLPPYESLKSFKVLIVLSGIGEEKRRNQIGFLPDKYWWQNDLSDMNILKQMLGEKLTQYPFWILEKKEGHNPVGFQNSSEPDSGS